MTEQAKRFTGDGYTDREQIAQEIMDDGFLWARDRDTMEGIVAVVCERLLRRINEQQDLRDRGVDLLCSVAGIVDCAEKEGLLPT